MAYEEEEERDEEIVEAYLDAYEGVAPVIEEAVRRLERALDELKLARRRRPQCTFLGSVIIDIEEAVKELRGLL
jgi:hypothetical protein